jgi:cation diffusion facilitator CzcD-associated flavoprotein CzcO
MPSNESSLSEPVHIDPSQWAFKPRKLRVVCIGAGFSGLILAYKLKHEQPLEFVDFRIYEKNSEVGGTWLENVYPGVGCDVPAHSYIFPFEPNPSWSKCYVGGAEIQEYILNTVQKYGLRYPIQFETRLISSIWNEETGKWRLQLRQGDGNVIDDEADILINASGILNQPTLPNVEGLDRFKGKVLHTGAWDRSYEYKGKRIGVIGNGSSGVQAVPALQPNAAKIINYIRNPTWISVNLCPDITRDGMGTNFEYTEEEKALYQNDPKGFLEHRKVIECS